MDEAITEPSPMAKAEEDEGGERRRDRVRDDDEDEGDRPRRDRPRAESAGDDDEAASDRE
jgi:hypothetical protein